MRCWPCFDQFNPNYAGFGYLFKQCKSVFEQFFNHILFEICDDHKKQLGRHIEGAEYALFESVVLASANSF